jgi:hypothetical protein
MSQKNPYEIRADILAMAKSYLDSQMHLNIEYAKKMQELGHMQIEEYKNAFKPYSLQELHDIANKMYNFVSTKN